MRIPRIRFSALLTVALLATSLGTPTSRAAVINTSTQVDQTANGGVGISAQSSNAFGSNVALASAGATFGSTDFSAYSGSNPSYLIDGQLGFDSTGTGIGTAVNTGSSTDWTFTLTLDTSVNTLGYNIDNIIVISGWSSDFVNQNFTVAYSTNNITFNSLGGGFTLDNSGGSPNGWYSLQSSLTETSGAPLGLTHVKALQFVFSREGGTFAAYREIEAFGMATVVPEPSTWALLGLGLGSLFVAVRRRRLG